MALHTLGLAELRRKSNGQVGLGLATGTARRRWRFT